jgi:16S rRNA processing protein RimM
LELRTDQPKRRFQVGSVYTVEPDGPDRAGDAPARLTLLRFRADSGRAVAGFAEVEGRDAAEALRGVRLAAEVDPAEEPDAWYPAQLRGAEVFLPDGTPVGAVSDLIAMPGQDLLEIDQPDCSKALVPLVKALVLEVDLDRMRIVVDPPRGLVAARPLTEED